MKIGGGVCSAGRRAGYFASRSATSFAPRIWLTRIGRRRARVLRGRARGPGRAPCAVENGGAGGREIGINVPSGAIKHHSTVSVAHQGSFLKLLTSPARTASPTWQMTRINQTLDSGST